MKAAFIIGSVSRGGDGSSIRTTSTSSASSSSPLLSVKTNDDKHHDVKKQVLIVMDGFCSYHSGYFIDRVQELYPHVHVLRVVSDYLHGYLQHQPTSTVGDVAENEPQLPIRRPRTVDEVHDWIKQSFRNDNTYTDDCIDDTDTETDIATTPMQQLTVSEDRDRSSSISNIEVMGVYCESDSGLHNAEELRQLLHTMALLHTAATDHPILNLGRRHKYVMQQQVASSTTKQLPTMKQQLCSNVSELKEFATEIFGRGRGRGDNCSNSLVLKPFRGVASESVTLCHTMDDVMMAWDMITSTQVFGESINHTNVLAQEFLNGTEYAVDVVSRNGIHKVTAVWRYIKKSSVSTTSHTTMGSTNNNSNSNATVSTTATKTAPFCYYRTELIDETMMIGDSDDETMLLYERICEYVTQSLTSLGIRYGISHNEVIVPYDDPTQPYLIEVNCRQHNMDFIPIVMNCIGYNCMDIAILAYLGDDATWDTVPYRPPQKLRRYGCMVHLVNSASAGYLGDNYHLLNEMMKLPSVYDAEVYQQYCTPGSFLSSPTIDIRTDAGWVQLVHDKAATMERDYQQIVDWMPIMFQTTSSSLQT